MSDYKETRSWREDILRKHNEVLKKERPGSAAASYTSSTASELADKYDEDRFWMVWVDKRDLPKIRHYNWDTAHDEAERLARKYEGEKVYLLKVAGHCVADQPPVRWRE